MDILLFAAALVQRRLGMLADIRLIKGVRFEIKSENLPVELDGDAAKHTSLIIKAKCDTSVKTYVPPVG